MSYTNQTQHYGLPQYVGTDVPAWLTDINGAFAAIDNGINAAKVQADSAATAAGQAANDITALQSTVGTQATQISAAAQAAATAQSTANGADTKADANTQAISGLDTRVTNLETSGAGVTVHNYAFSNVAVNVAYSSGFYICTEIAAATILPAGKTMADVKALTLITDSSEFINVLVRSSGVVFSSPTAVNAASGVLRVIL